MINATSTILLGNEIASSSVSSITTIDSTSTLLIILLLTLWVLPWKGFALWKASQNKDKKWFIAIFLLNTLAILEIIYIFIINKKKK